MKTIVRREKAMEEVIYYLELKNKYYEKFLSVSEKFFIQVQQDRWDNVEYFVDSRERILNIIRSYDFKIAELFQQSDVSEKSIEAYSGRVKELLDRREAMGKRIVDQDLILIGKIEEIRTDTIQELKNTQETGRKLHSFSSGENPPKRLKIPKDI